MVVMGRGLWGNKGNEGLNICLVDGVSMAWFLGSVHIIYYSHSLFFAKTLKMQLPINIIHPL